MSGHIFRCRAARRLLCSSQCLLSRRTRAYYSQSAPSFVAGRTRISDTSAAPTRTATWDDAAADSKNPLGSARLDRYLASIRAADLEPTLNDVERYKPDSFSRPDSSRYAEEYTNLLEMLCRSFSKDQLRRFTELYKLDPIWSRSSRRKAEYAESIIEKAWGWQSLKEIERKRRDRTEVLIKSFTITPSQLFLIMGKDGADLLQLSMQYNVHISLTSSPLALRVEGLRGSLKGLSEHISSLKKSIIDKIFELPSGRPIRPDLLQRISRLSGAYVENHGNRGKVRICAKDISDITTAEKLALRASLEVGTRERTVCYDPPSKKMGSPMDIFEPQRYAIYPFVTPYSSPWTMHCGGAFRLRRVADWLGIDSYEDIVSSGGLAENSERLLNLNKSGVTLSQLFCSVIPANTSYCRRTITATLGHVLISSGDNSQRESIFPSLRGTLSLSDILEWFETSRTPLTFVPSIPSLMKTGTVDERRALHRLIYRTLPQIADDVSRLPQYVLKFEIELSRPRSTRAEVTACLESATEQDTSGQSNSSADPQALSEAANNRLDPSCQVGREAYVNLMLPDRPMDMELCIFDWDSIASMQQPPELQEYVNNFRDFLANKTSHPNPPSIFRYEGREYYLYDSLHLRQSNNRNSSSTISSDCDADNLVEVSIEKTTDLQSTQKMELCQVQFDGVTGGPSWKHFLATCDQLSIMSLESRSKKGKPNQFT